MCCYKVGICCGLENCIEGYVGGVDCGVGWSVVWLVCDVVFVFVFGDLGFEEWVVCDDD